MTIQEHQARIREIEAITRPLSTELDQHEQAILELKSPFHTGDIIQWKYGNNKIRKGQVVRVKGWCRDDPMWVVKIIRKDGTLGDTADVYPYLKPTKV